MFLRKHINWYMMHTIRLKKKSGGLWACTFLPFPVLFWKNINAVFSMHIWIWSIDIHTVVLLQPHKVHEIRYYIYIYMYVHILFMIIVYHIHPHDPAEKRVQARYRINASEKHGFCRENSQENPKKTLHLFGSRTQRCCQSLWQRNISEATTEKVVESTTHQLLDVHQLWHWWRQSFIEFSKSFRVRRGTEEKDMFS